MTFKKHHLTMELNVENIFLTAFVWPMDNGGIIIWQTTRIRLHGLTYSGDVIELPSINLIEGLIEDGITSNLDKMSCHQEE